MSLTINTCRETVNICRTRSATYQFQVIINDNGTPIDITGWDVRYTVRKSPPANDVVDDVDAIISAVAVLTDPTNGVALFTIPDTGDDSMHIPIGEYYYDIATEDLAGKKDIPVGGALTVQYSITQD